MTDTQFKRLIKKFPPKISFPGFLSYAIPLLGYPEDFYLTANESIFFLRELKHIEKQIMEIEYWKMGLQ